MVLDLPSTSETLSPLGLPLPAGHSRKIIANGTKGTAQTIELMQGMVNSYKRNDEIRNLAGKIIKDCKPKDYYEYAKKCYEWVRDNIKYAYDPVNVEYVEKPTSVLRNKIGDCDSQDMLLCSLFEQLGFNAQFVTIKADANRPNEFSHVYTRVKVPKVGWVTADPIMPEKTFGWEPPYPNGRRYWPASTDEVGQPVDTSPSISTDDGGDNGFFGLADCGQRLEGLGHGGRGRRGWRGGGGYGYGGPYGYWPSPIVVAPLLSPDQVELIEEQDVTPQMVESPLMDYSRGINNLSGFKGLGANKLSDDTTESWIVRFNNGSLANEITAKRDANRANAKKILALKRSAQALPAGSKKDVALKAVLSAESAVLDETSLISQSVIAYNEVVDALKKYSGGLYSAQKVTNLSGPWLIGLGVAGAAAVAYLIYNFTDVWDRTTQQTSVVNVRQIEASTLIANNAREDLRAGRITSEQYTRIVESLSKSGSSTGLTDWLKGLYTGTGSSLLTTGLLLGGAWILYRGLDRYMNRPHRERSEPRDTRKTEPVSAAL